MILLGKMIHGTFYVGSEFVLILFRVAESFVWLGIALFIGNNLWKIFRKPISKLMPMKKERVEVIRMVPRDRFRFVQKNDLVFVKFQSARWRKRRKFWMQAGGIREGDQGLFFYQGVYGVDFKKEDSALKDQISLYQKFDFAKQKKRDTEEAEKNQRDRRKRKYW